MAVNSQRSMNAELTLGATDGSIRRWHCNDRGGIIEPTSDEAHAKAVEMGMGPATTAYPYGEGDERVTLAGIRRR
jgi:hypothetical protein